MRKTSQNGTIYPAALAASAILGFITLASLLIVPFGVGVVADMRLSPSSRTIEKDTSFTVEVVVEARVPVNVFAGELTFDKDILSVASIDYNTSIADLWAEEPWYSNGDGTLRFAGGTTRDGGFTGTDTLLTITFTTLKEGAGALVIKDAKILQHDGLGTEATLAAPIDALFTVSEEQETTPENLLQRTVPPTTYAVVRTPPSTDLNSDGKHSIADVSILMMNIGNDDMRFDFNLDGSVNLKDLNILLGSL